MTIKQQGGIFGRNPTFNDVDVEGALTVDGLPVVGGTGTMASQDANAVAITGGAINGTTVGAASKSTGAFTTIVGDSATSGYLSTLQNTLGSAAGNGLYVQTRYNNATNIVAKFTTNSGTSDVLTLNGDRNMTLHAGNLVIGTSGKGIDFSATAGTGTSELFSDYEEGVWTATPVFASGTPTGAVAGSYTKVGNIVSASVYMGLGIGTGSGNFSITGLPFTCTQTSAVAVRTAGVGATGTVLQANVVSGGTAIGFLLAPQSTSLAGAIPTSSEINSPDSYWQLSVTYKV